MYHLQGNCALFRVALAFLHSHEKALLAMHDQGELLQQLVARARVTVDGQALLALGYSRWLLGAQFSTELLDRLRAQEMPVLLASSLSRSPSRAQSESTCERDKPEHPETKPADSGGEGDIADVPPPLADTKVAHRRAVLLAASADFENINATNTTNSAATNHEKKKKTASTRPQRRARAAVPGVRRGGGQSRRVAPLHVRCDPRATAGARAGLERATPDSCCGGRSGRRAQRADGRFRRHRATATARRGPRRVRRATGASCGALRAAAGSLAACACLSAWLRVRTALAA